MTDPHPHRRKFFIDGTPIPPALGIEGIRQVNRHLLNTLTHADYKRIYHIR